MPPIARKCLVWAIVLIVVGSTWSVFGIDIITSYYGTATTSFGFAVYTILSGFFLFSYQTFISVGGALIGATVVLSVLLPRLPSIAEPESTPT